MRTLAIRATLLLEYGAKVIDIEIHGGDQSPSISRTV
jgi:hypothetical protein